jgi:hypothetical protein
MWESFLIGRRGGLPLPFQEYRGSASETVRIRRIRRRSGTLQDRDIVDSLRRPIGSQLFGQGCSVKAGTELTHSDQPVSDAGVDENNLRPLAPNVFGQQSEVAHQLEARVDRPVEALGLPMLPR